MDNLQVLTDRGWIRVIADQIQEGDYFRVTPSDNSPGEDDNPDGDDIFVALSDATVVGGETVVNIQPPSQKRFARTYLDRLAGLGIFIQKRGNNQPDFFDVVS